MCGGTYAVGTVVILGYEDDSYLFGEIEYIFSVDGTFFLCCKKMITMEYRQHYHAYILDDMGLDRWSLVKPSQLLDRQSLGLYRVDGEKAVVLKYHVSV